MNQSGLEQPSPTMIIAPNEPVEIIPSDSASIPLLQESLATEETTHTQKKKKKKKKKQTSAIPEEIDPIPPP